MKHWFYVYGTRDLMLLGSARVSKVYRSGCSCALKYFSPAV